MPRAPRSSSKTPWPKTPWDHEDHPVFDLWHVFGCLLEFAFGSYVVPYLTGGAGKIHKTKRAELLRWLTSLEDFARRLLFLRAAELRPGLSAPPLKPATPKKPGARKCAKDNGPETGPENDKERAPALRFRVPPDPALAPCKPARPHKMRRALQERSVFYDTLPLARRFRALTRLLDKVLLKPKTSPHRLHPGDGALKDSLDEARAAAALFRGSG